jgi:hypothetical protein
MFFQYLSQHSQLKITQIVNTKQNAGHVVRNDRANNLRTIALRTPCLSYIHLCIPTYILSRVSEHITQYTWHIYICMFSTAEHDIEINIHTSSWRDLDWIFIIHCLLQLGTLLLALLWTPRKLFLNFKLTVNQHATRMQRQILTCGEQCKWRNAYHYI